ncbi:hypothetical protein BB347_17450 (plasmid) [Natronorubrum daqingense]|uniref:Uncharacterized protein n=1 Tax=Natronorubrum daqingense TaxID=588898 RepID=A0A1P8RIM5_9EURY|nr:hypothetical protein BB347_17450 [Natronorubrum daqingense]
MPFLNPLTTKQQARKSANSANDTRQSKRVVKSLTQAKCPTGATQWHQQAITQIRVQSLMAILAETATEAFNIHS